MLVGRYDKGETTSQRAAQTSTHVHNMWDRPNRQNGQEAAFFFPVSFLVTFALPVIIVLICLLEHQANPHLDGIDWNRVHIPSRVLHVKHEQLSLLHPKLAIIPRAFLQKRLKRREIVTMRRDRCVDHQMSAEQALDIAPFPHEQHKAHVTMRQLRLDTV